MPSLDLPRPVRRPYGRLPSGEAVDVWTLDDGHGLTARVLTYGGILQSLDVPDAHGRSDNVVLGFTGLADYLHRSPYFGATVGRYANRIRAGRFDLDGTRVRLPLNDPPRSNTLHGGPHGFSTRLWTAQSLARPGASGVTLRLTSPDGEEGFPGTLHVTVTYLVRRAELHIEYEAVTDAATVVNLTNHSYFNLAGEGADEVLDHELTVAAGEYLPVDDQLIPIAEAPLPVAGTPFDHREPRLLRDGVISPHQQVRLAGGFDHCWVLGRAPAPGPRAAARLVHRGTGRALDVLTTEPGIQVYTGNMLDGTLAGSSDRVYRRHCGVALETQHLPDSPNRPDFPATTLRPGEAHRSATIWRFTHV
jgi:aldose 1-epimerase